MLQLNTVICAYKNEFILIKYNKKKNNSNIIENLKYKYECKKLIKNLHYFTDNSRPNTCYLLSNLLSSRSESSLAIWPSFFFSSLIFQTKC